MRNSFLEVNLNNISYNLKKIKQFVGKDVELVPVIKANGYGTGAVSLKKVLEENNINYVCVAIPDEAIILRNNNFNMNILVLNELLPEETRKIIDYNLTACVSDYNVAKCLNEFSKEKNVISKIHVEVDTGMGRVGLKPKEILNFVKFIQNELKNLEIEGLFTHFSSADSSIEYTNMQIEIFDNVIKNLKSDGFEFKFYHAAASGGILKFKNAHYNMVRPGIIIYGYLPDESMKNILDLKPVTKLKSSVTFIKNVEKGMAISYGRTYITSKHTKIATIPIGYADGIRRYMSNNGKVLINNKFAPIIGNICMDNFMVDVTDIPEVKIGDEVIIWDNEKITIEEIAKKCNTINYEVLCNISERIPKKYITNDNYNLC